MYIKGFLYQLEHKDTYLARLGIKRLNPKFKKLMNQIEKEIKMGKAVEFIYANNRISVRSEE